MDGGQTQGGATDDWVVTVSCYVSVALFDCDIEAKRVGKNLNKTVRCSFSINQLQSRASILQSDDGQCFYNNNNRNISTTETYARPFKQLHGAMASG